MKKLVLFTAVYLGLGLSLQDLKAAKLEGESSSTGKRGANNPSVSANCTPPSNRTDLDINNTRALIQTGGDMWWDLVGQPRYEIPKGSGSNSMFAGSLWLGGQDVSGQLKVAAQRFRSQGNDFWTGPLSTVDAEITPATCVEWDKHFMTYRDEVARFRAWFLCNSDPECDASEEFPNYQIPRSILEWPAHGRNFAPYNEDYYLAPFFDFDGDGNYDPNNGDYPRYDLDGNTDCQQRIVDIYGDQNLWWIFNDKGNIHTESNGDAIGMEIRAQAFAFATNDEVNNMTFYNYELVNRSSFQLTNTYFGFWVDVDLGNPQDDFVGCDVQKGFGYGYNGDEVDEDLGGAKGYGSNPPAIGVDFFQGPFQDNDQKDNCLCENDYFGAIADDGVPYKGLGVGYGDSIVDNERLGMRAFLYHNNNNSPTGDPRTATEYYNFLRSFWRDNTKMVYGGTGFQGSVPPPYIESDFMFPATSDVIGWGTGGVPQPNWTEVTAGNAPFDRRFVQSSGPFTLAPGAVNNITVGVVWSRANSGGRLASVEKLLRDDEKTQALFDNCFRLLDGPDAPEIEVIELDKQLVLRVYNLPTSNNFNESYAEVNPFIVAPDTFTFQERVAYSTFKFQGYQIFQLKDASVSAADLYDDTKARLVAQCDIKDSITNLTNFVFSLDINAEVAFPRVVDAENNGISKTFSIIEDRFAAGDRGLINHKTYYFMVIAYAHNEFKPYRQNEPEFLDGQKEPYLPSRKAATGPIRIVTAIPHKTDFRNGGTILQSQYGQGVPVTRIEGIGNSSNNLDITPESIEKALMGAPWKIERPTYVAGRGPINVKVIDPLSVKAGKYTMAFVDSTQRDYSDARYVVYGENLDTILVDKPLSVMGEEVIPEIGISITVDNSSNPGQSNAVQNGFVSSRLEFEDPSKPWLIGLANEDGPGYRNWIRSGLTENDDNPMFADYPGLDDDQWYENVLGGTWAPFRLAGWSTHAPALNLPTLRFTNLGLFQGLPVSSADPAYQLNYLQGVDIVFTNDKSKWTRVVVVETQEDVSLSQGNAPKLRPRRFASVDKNGIPYAGADSAASTNPEAPNYISAHGMGWFPGYAINVETGERLNMAFGEDSYLIGSNGRDMLWNPTSVISDGVIEDANIRFGGKHFIYVFRNNIVEEQRYLLPLRYNAPENRMPSYDEGKFMIEKLNTGIVQDFQDVWRSCMWTGIPMLREGQQLLSTNASVKLRVSRRFETYAPGIEYASVGNTLQVGIEYFVRSGPISYNGVDYLRGDIIRGLGGSTPLESTPQTGSDSIDVLVKTVNGGRPMYEFDLTGLEPRTNLKNVAESALDLINIVPNPYYAYSQYELDKLDNRVKIINLPQRCNIKIYTMNGVLVREFTKDDPNAASIDWDLKNHIRIPIASGVYLIHIDVPGVGEKVLKWFGVMRPVDLDAF